MMDLIIGGGLSVVGSAMLGWYWWGYRPGGRYDQ